MSQQRKTTRKTLQIVNDDDLKLEPRFHDSSILSDADYNEEKSTWQVIDSVGPHDSVSEVSKLLNDQAKLEVVRIQTQIDQCKERHDIQKAKLSLQNQEELLNLKMELALANAKIDSDNDNWSGRSTGSKQLNRNQSYSQINATSSYIANHSKQPSAKQLTDDKSLTHITPVDTPPTHTPPPQNSFDSNMFMTVVKELKKPKTQIDKFSGNIMYYKKFLRQFNYAVSCIDNYDEKMNLLEYYTQGEAGTIVAGFGHLDSKVGYFAALQELEDRYGDDEVIASAYIDKALHWPKISTPKDLDKFSIFLGECEHAVSSMSNIDILDHRDSLRSIVRRLPLNLHEKWATLAQSIKESASAGNQRAKFHDLVQFVKRESKKVNDPTFGKEALGDINTKSPFVNKKYPLHQNKVFSTSLNRKHEASIHIAFKRPCLFCKDDHELQQCAVLQKKTNQEKVNFLSSLRLCYGCLKFGHTIKECKFKSKCDICYRWHPTLMHDEDFERKHQTSVKQLSTACSNSTEAGEGVCTMNIIPVVVKLRGGSKTIKTYAFKDSGSSVTFCTTNLMNALGVTGKRKMISLNTMGSSYKMVTYILHDLQIMDLDMINTIDLPTVYTKDRMPVTHDYIPTEQDISQYDHLKHLKLPQIQAEIGLLIGNRIADAYTPLEVISGGPNTPHACLTKLGWSVCNLVRPTSNSQAVNSILINRCEINYVNELDNLEQLLHKSINYDFPEKSMAEKAEYSVQDKRFLQMVNSSIRHLDNGHYEIGLPFKSADVVLPNNFKQAEYRLNLLKGRFNRQPKFKEDYIEFMNKIMSNGYAVKVSDAESYKDTNVWYIPHHGVYNPNKPGIRVVFDCSAKFHGVSLNNMLLSGPDLTSKLLSVLMRFRQETIAVLADITSMYYMVYVPERDTNFLRFLWYENGDTENRPIAYKMRVHIFGATSSPSCAISALQRTATDHQTSSNSEAVKTVLRNFYVDDCLRSVPTEEEAIKLVKDLSDICRSGGFQLSKWMSNSREVLATIPVDQHAKGLKSLNLELDNLPVERALGVFWKAETDVLGFKINIQDRPPTKRGILSTVSSIYDPLGLAAPLVLPAKVILQNLCQLKLNWDDPIPENILVRWNLWLSDLPDLEKVSIKRCYKPKDFGDISSVQLHSFSDASESGYGAGIYLRQTNTEGRIHCSLVLGKSRVTPLKRITIPRLELTAATTALRLSQMVIDDLDINFRKTDIFYWTDSQSVLRYLANTKSRFQTFVANRIDRIRESTELFQWKYVDSKSNIADVFSRGISKKKNQLDMKWLYGPDFLWKTESEWPVTDISLKLLDDDCEVKRSQLLVTSTDVDKQCDIMERLLNYHSKWLKLKQTVAWLLHGMSNLKMWVEKRRDLNISLMRDYPDPLVRSELVDEKMTKLKKNSQSSNFQHCMLDPEKLDEAENRILKYVQLQHFTDDISCLKTGKRLKSSSRLLKLDPYIKDGLICAGGRLKRSNLSAEAINPVVLPKDSPVSSLILQDIHIKVGHLGRNSMLTTLRQKYWMLKANTAIRSLVSKCVICRRYRAKGGEQKMADLPADRLIADEKPFTVTGIDFFGTFEVKQGRSVVKRYGVVFTCVRSRAIHIELAYSLDTDACFNAIRRFINRRGPVKVFKSDNGSNFVSANKEIKEEFKKLDIEKLQHLCLYYCVKWEFNPPTASHFGGIWERLIRTIRKILFALFKEQSVRLTDDGLHTLFSEVESIINSRPITRTQDDPNDLSALTPNNLLLLNNIGSFPLGTFNHKDNYVRRRWRQVQYISDIFWKRWSAEYLSSLIERQKWYFPRRNLCVNDIVLLIDNTVSRNSWCFGRIIDIIRDKNGLVRIVKVKCKENVFERPVDKICLLLEADRNIG